MKLRKVTLSKKDIFTDRVVYVAEPGKGVRKLIVVYRVTNKCRYSTISISKEAQPLPQVPLTRRHKYLTSDELISYIEKLDPNFKVGDYLNKCGIIEDCVSYSQAIMLLSPGSKTGYVWSLHLIRGSDSATRLFAKEKHAIKYSKYDPTPGLESLFDFMDE